MRSVVAEDLLVEWAGPAAVLSASAGADLDPSTDVTRALRGLRAAELDDMSNRGQVVARLMLMEDRVGRDGCAGLLVVIGLVAKVIFGVVDIGLKRGSAEQPGVDANNDRPTVW